LLDFGCDGCDGRIEGARQFAQRALSFQASRKVRVP
jgi:hypothetical protein